MTDPLTGAHNRRYAIERLHELWASSRRFKQPLSCLVIDLDHFKQINDRFGHPFGDIVLQNIVRVLKQQLRANDVLARTGGEEFVVLCENTNAEGALTCAERLRQAVACCPVRFGDTEVRVTVSIGIAECTPEMTEPEELLQAADRALYAAKQAGRNCCRVATTVSDTAAKGLAGAANVR